MSAYEMPYACYACGTHLPFYLFVLTTNSYSYLLHFVAFGLFISIHVEI